jgi:hypothetical protein
MLAGCTGNSAGKPAPQVVDAQTQARLDKLDPADRKLAQAQKWCAVETDHPLGEMGVPFKVMIKDQPVFLCCDNCEKRAKANPEKTLEIVATLKAKASAGE